MSFCAKLELHLRSCGRSPDLWTLSQSDPMKLAKPSPSANHSDYLGNTALQQLISKRSSAKMKPASLVCVIYTNLKQKLVHTTTDWGEIGHPVRSAIHKPQIGRLVVASVMSSEYLLLYVFIIFWLLSFGEGGCLLPRATSLTSPSPWIFFTFRAL